MKAPKFYFDYLKDFLLNSLWEENIEKFPVKKRLFYFVLRCTIFPIYSFLTKKTAIKASALTYYTLMSIVPLLALVLGVARGFGLGDVIEEELKKNVVVSSSSIEFIFEFAQNMINNAKGGIFTGLGLVILLYSVIRALGNIENSFNAIWGVRQKRSLARQFSDYLSVMLLAPIFLISLSGINVFLAASMKSLGSEYTIIGTISPIIIKLLSLLPYFILWILFIFLYIFIPNTRVKFVPAVISGIITGTLIQLLQWGYITFQIGVSSYSAVYGSFAAIPLLLFWIQLSWSVVLMGAHFCFYLQNNNVIEFLNEMAKPSFQSYRIMSVIVLREIIQTFKRGESPMSTRQLSEILDIKYVYIRETIDLLLACNFIIELNNDEIRYLPSRDIHDMNLSNLYMGLERIGKDISKDLLEVDKKLINKLKKKFNISVEENLDKELVLNL